MIHAHEITIVLSLQRNTSLAFDPKAHNNYEFAHSYDEIVLAAVKDSLPNIKLNAFSTIAIDVAGIESELVLTETEQRQADLYSAKEQRAFRINMNSLERIGREVGIKNAIWSGDATADNIASKAFVGNVKFVYKSDWSGVKDTYESPIYKDPTFIQAWKEFDKAIEFTNDHHHVFLEGFEYICNDFGDVQVFTFSAGS